MEFTKTIKYQMEILIKEMFFWLVELFWLPKLFVGQLIKT